MKKFLLFVFLVALCAAGLYRCNQGRRPPTRPERFTPAAGPRLDGKDVEVLAAIDREFTRLVGAVVPSVVSITTAKRERVPDPAIVDPFEFFFGHRYRSVPVERVRRSLGSGVIVSREGHVLTNYHVIADVDEIQIQLHDGRTAAARLIGGDPRTDLALLRLEGIATADLTPLALGDSAKVVPGQRVVAIGNPFGLEETVTQGIISAIGRAASDTGVEYLQTDSAINPGNSGGPLVDLRGEIVGINTAIGGQTGNWAGVGFAVPANVARDVMAAILRDGTVVRGFLGVVPQAVTAELAAELGLKDRRGALLAEVAPNSPAADAGLRRRDVVVEYDGRPVGNPNDLRRWIADTKVGRAVEIVVVRDGQRVKLNATIAELSPDLTAGGPADGAPPPGRVARQAFAGVRVAEIPPAFRRSLPAGIEGAFVTEIAEEAPAAKALQAGDIIEEVNRTTVRSAREFSAAAEGLAAGQKAVVLLFRDGRHAYVVVNP